MASFNRVVLLGNITRDLDLRYTPGGTAVVDIGLAVNESHKNSSGERVDTVMFIDCTCFGRTAEVSKQYLSKGAPVLFEGRLKLEQWENDGQPRSKHKVIVDRMQMLGSRSDHSGASAGKTSTSSEQYTPSNDYHGDGEDPAPF